MRRKWKSGRWEGATDGGLHANSKLSLAEPSQTGMRAFPQVGAAWTLGEAASQRPRTSEGDRDQGRWGLALGMDLGSCPGPRLIITLTTHSFQRHTVCPSRLCLSFLSLSRIRLIGWRRPASIGVSRLL